MIQKHAKTPQLTLPLCVFGGEDNATEGQPAGQLGRKLSTEQKMKSCVDHSSALRHFITAVGHLGRGDGWPAMLSARLFLLFFRSKTLILQWQRPLCRPHHTWASARKSCVNNITPDSSACGDGLLKFTPYETDHVHCTAIATGDLMPPSKKQI